MSFVQMYNSILFILILVIISSLNCSEIVMKVKHINERFVYDKMANTLHIIKQFL
jgi:hypothetical protein